MVSPGNPFPLSMSTFSNHTHTGQTELSISGLISPVSTWKLPPIFKRLHKFQQMDYEMAAWQLTYLCVAPRKVYKLLYLHKQTKNTWARDDPAILVLIGGCIVFVSILWSIVYTLHPSDALTLALTMVFRDFFLLSLLVAAFLYFLANILFRIPAARAATTGARHPGSASAGGGGVPGSFELNYVEYAYAFDIAINAFFPSFLTLGVVQALLIAVITRSYWVCLFLGNTIYLIAFGQYIIGVYFGLSSLPFLHRTEAILFLLLPLICVYALTLSGINVPKIFLEKYFG